MKKILISMCLVLASMTAQAQLNTEFLSGQHAMVRAEATSKYVLLPVEEKAEMSHIRVNAGNQLVQTLNVRLAIGKVDYYVPLDISVFGKDKVLLDIRHNGNLRNEGALKGFACWKAMKQSDTFDTTNREKFRPVYHHTPVYGWMNDPNGLFYKDGEWHLFYQHNPYGSQWENMTWSHSVSKDLNTWENRGVAIAPDAIGTIFSGCAVVDHNNTAGFGEGAIIAFYTSAGENQTQSMAYSTDNGKTFVKYDGNPVVTSNVPDFRDPKVIWHEGTKRWVMVLASGQEMSFYSSANLKEWKHESYFGLGYGNHDGVWECPDLMELPVRGTDQKKWMLICNINPGCPFGGSATQYFIGDFDGKKFTCESAPEVTKWMDWGKDHYAAVTFDNAPDGRKVILGWMSNWQYANQVPTMQYRSANTIARDLDLYTYNGETYVGVTPSQEVDNGRGNILMKRSKSKAKSFSDKDGAYEIVVNITSKKKPTVLTLKNSKDEEVVMTYDPIARTFSMNREKSGLKDFSEAFPVTTVAPVYNDIKTLRIFVDKSSIEAIDADGCMSMTNIVFPEEPYNQILQTGARAAITVYDRK